MSESLASLICIISGIAAMSMSRRGFGQNNDNTLNVSNVPTYIKRSNTCHLLAGITLGIGIASMLIPISKKS